MKEKEKKATEPEEGHGKGMKDTLKETFEHPMLQLLLGNPALIGILDDVQRGEDLDSAIGRNMKGWQKRREIGDLAIDDCDEATREKVRELMQEFMEGGDHQAMGAMLAKGMRYEESVETARAEGYLKGKNEKIEIMRAQHATGIEGRNREETAAQFPTYRRKSIWDREQ